MKVKLIIAKVKTGFSPEVTMSDKRYKRGYRILQEAYMTYSLHLCLENPGFYFRVGDAVRTEYGLFRVVSRDLVNEEPKMNLISFHPYNTGNKFEFSHEIDVSLSVRAHIEGSSYTQI